MSGVTVPHVGPSPCGACGFALLSKSCSRLCLEVITNMAFYRWFWVSFAAEDLLLGIAIVQALDPDHAIQRVTELGLHPGGDAIALLMPDHPLADQDRRNLGTYKLIDEEEFLETGCEWFKITPV